MVALKRYIPETSWSTVLVCFLFYLFIEKDQLLLLLLYVKKF